VDMKREDRLALGSGSTAGIGNAIAAGLAREGARAIVNGCTQAAVDSAAAKVRSATGNEVRGFAGDLSKSRAAALVREHPGIEILVNNLGIFEPKPFEDIPDADWMRFFDVNVMSGARLRPAVSAGDEVRELGPDHLHLERGRRADPGGNDPLWSHQ
jgi:NAD(P)-dependent dehydrogenase (short-subunit alcohol dehydrogenase family)